MPVFQVMFGNVLVGTTALESADKSMGVAFGIFHPAPGYASVRREVVDAAEARSAGSHASGPALELRSGGRVFSTGFVCIDDFDVPVTPEISVQFEDAAEWRELFGNRT